MPEHRLQKTREAYRDVPQPDCTCKAPPRTSWWMHANRCAVYQEQSAKRWRHPADNAAEQIAREAIRQLHVDLEDW